MTGLLLTSRLTYGRLPSLAEIEATFGNDETGHIGYLALP